MKITATIDPKIALAAGKNVAGRQEMDLTISQLSAAERELLSEVSVTKQEGLEIIHYQHIAHDMPALDMESLRAYLARIAARQADDAAAKAARYEELRQQIMAGELPTEFAVNYYGHSFNYGISYDMWKALRDMPETQAMLSAASAVRDEEAAASKAAADSEAARKAAEAQDARDKMLAWIASVGSPRLRRCVAEGIECHNTYCDERLAADRPGWRWDIDVRGGFGVPCNPPEEAFEILDEARKTAPDARLGRHYAEEETDDDGEVTEPEWQGYVAHAEFLGLPIVYGGPNA